MAVVWEGTLILRCEYLQMVIEVALLSTMLSYARALHLVGYLNIQSVQGAELYLRKMSGN